MIQITKQTFGNGEKVLVKLSGDNRKEVIQNFWLFINRGCVKFKGVDDRVGEIEDDTGFNWIIDDLEGYFRTNQNEFISALQSISLFRLLHEIDPHYELDVIPPHLDQQSKKIGLKWFLEIPEENVTKVDMDVENE